MQPYEEIIKGDLTSVADIWLRMCEDCKGTQERVLKGILANASKSRIGKERGFADIDSIERYREVMGISDYHDIEDMVEEIASTGAEGLLYDGPTIFMTSTSGTTGKNKLIPESAPGQDAKNAVTTARGMMFMRALMGYATSKGADGSGSNGMDPTADVFSLRLFSLASAMPSTMTEGGIEVGFASGRTMNSFGSKVEIAYPPMLMGLKDKDAAMYLTMLFAMRHDDVRIIAGNNAARMIARIAIAQERAEQLIHDMRTGTIDQSLALTPEERTALESKMVADPGRADELQRILDMGRDEFVPRNYWPGLLAAEFWLAGSVGVNVERIRPMLGDIAYFDVGYGASEAKMNIPSEVGVGHGALATFAAFYEFIPVGSDEILTADQLVDGGEYELILTTYSGLYRYNIQDVVKVRGFTGNTPNIEFLTKSREILNISQEKVPAPALLDSIHAYARSKGSSIRQAQVWPDYDSRCYQLFLESDIGLDPVDLDSFIGSSFPMYGRNRDFGAMEPVRVFRMREGWQDHLFEVREASGAPVSQIKLDSLAKTRPEDDWILEEIRI